jgi:hypothetical protein
MEWRKLHNEELSDLYQGMSVHIYIYIYICVCVYIHICNMYTHSLIWLLPNTTEMTHIKISDLYCSPNIVRMIKWRRMRWAGHVSCMGER